MGKSRKKPDSEVDSDPEVVALPINHLGNGKVFEEPVVSSKKQKIANGDKEQAVEKKNFGKEIEENTEEEIKAEVTPLIKSGAIAEDAKRATFSSEYEKEDRDDNSKGDHHHLETPTKSVKVLSAIKSVETAQDAKRASISIEYEKEHKDDNSKEDHHHLKNPTKIVEVPPGIKSEETRQDEEEDRDDNSKEDQQQLESPKKSVQTPFSPQAQGSKTVLMDNLSFLIKEEDVKIFFKNVGEIAEIHFEVKEDYFAGHGHVQFTTMEAAQQALKLNNGLLLDQHVRLHLAPEKGEQPTTPLATGSKTLYLGNLSFSIEEDDVRDFFKDVGQIANIRFAIRNDRFLGFGYIEFITMEAAQEALKLNNGVILDRPVKLDLARQRGSYTPGPGSSFEKSNQRGRTIYVRGFDSTDGFDNIRNALEKHFGKCGEISRLSIPKDYESGAPKGVAFMEFAESKGFGEALGLNGSEMGGNRITVEEAKNKRNGGGSGGGRGYYNGTSGGFGGSRGGGRWQ